MKRWHANLILLVAGATWGMGFVAQATAMDSIGPFLFIALRFIVASAAVLPFALIESRRQSALQEAAPLSSQDWLKFCLIGLCLFAGMATQQVGLLSTSVTNSGFLTGLYVVFTPILGILLFRDFPHRITWVAATLALAGIHMLSGGNLGALVVGDLLTIGSAVFWSLQVVMIARFVGQSGRPMALSLTQFAVTGLVALVIALSWEPLVWSDVLEVAPQILYSGIVASGLAFTLQVIGQRYTTAPQAAIFLSSEAPFAAFFAFLWLDERIGLPGVAGCVLIFIAMLAVELVPQWKAAKNKASRTGSEKTEIRELVDNSGSF